VEKLKEFDLHYCRLSSLPKELGELTGLTTLDLSVNENLGITTQDEAFPAELGEMKSLRALGLAGCGLRAVPAFVGELESLERLELS
jgi:Leucine-rich repeat (LRR) protein